MQHPSPHKIILGIDPGTRITGFGVIKMKNGSSEPLDFGCIRPPQKLEISERYLVIFNAIDHLIETYQPHAVAIETQFVYKNAQSAMKLGMARGMAILAAARRKIPIYEYAPKKAKKAVVGNGAASKEQVQRMIQVLLRLPQLPEPEDAADALALALCHAHAIPFLNIKN
ncbi:MAG TPA: crossover junction endodeoxyribonuclease RuvC [Rhabdochlamydiaceae bacterium]|nr:crossover junction endodeoxyribonuclease RuvC [Rhabdochlamydiaceae bacterium]